MSNGLISNGGGDTQLAVGLGVAVFDDAPEQFRRQHPHACSASQPRVLAPARVSHTHTSSWRGTAATRTGAGLLARGLPTQGRGNARFEAMRQCGNAV